MKKYLIIGAVAGLALGAVYAFFQPRLFAASARLLVTQNAASGLDPYTAIKTSERVATSLSQLIYTSTFMAGTLTRAQGFNPDYFPTDDQARLSAWSQAVGAKVAADTGILKIMVFHPACDQAKILASALVDELVAKAPDYFGSGVRAQLVDGPLCSNRPAKPDVFKLTLGGGLVGLLFSSILLLSKYRSGA